MFMMSFGISRVHILQKNFLPPLKCYNSLQVANGKSRACVSSCVFPIGNNKNSVHLHLISRHIQVISDGIPMDSMETDGINMLYSFHKLFSLTASGFPSGNQVLNMECKSSTKTHSTKCFRNYT